VGGVEEDFANDDAINAKDNKEKSRRRRKRRKRPVVAGSSEPSQRSEREVTLHPSVEAVVNGDHGQETARIEEDRMDAVKVEVEDGDEAPSYSVCFLSFCWSQADVPFKSSGKGKGRAKPNSLKSLTHANFNLNLGSGSSETVSTVVSSPGQSSEIARLKEQLAEQRKASHFFHSLTSSKANQRLLWRRMRNSYPATREASIAFAPPAASLDVPDLLGTFTSALCADSVRACHLLWVPRTLVHVGSRPS
jgi:hypothetical protein